MCKARMNQVIPYQWVSGGKQAGYRTVFPGPTLGHTERELWVQVRPTSEETCSGEGAFPKPQLP